VKDWQNGFVFVEQRISVENVADCVSVKAMRLDASAEEKQ